MRLKLEPKLPGVYVYIYTGCIKKCTPFQIQISHNITFKYSLLCSKLAHFISYADLNNA